MIPAIVNLVASLAGGGVQPEGNKSSGANAGLIKGIMDMGKEKPETDKGFYGHMSVGKANGKVNIIGNAGKGFINNLLKEDKAFNRSSNISGNKRG